MAPIGQVLDRCASTNDEARKLAEGGAPEGAWISARQQSAGRGRLGRQWSSDEGNLFLSVIVRSPLKSHWTWVPLAAAVGVAEFLNARFPALRVKIKWPNDLVTSSGKLAGILCESVGNKKESFIVVGLGLNCARAPDVQGPFLRATSISSEIGREITADELRTEAVEALLAAVRLLSRGKEGAKELSERYAQYAFLASGTRVEWDSAAGARSGEVLGLGAMGELRVLVNGSGEESLYAEDVRIARIRAVPKEADESPA